MTKMIENPEDILNEKFGALTIIEYLGYYRKKKEGKKHHYRCKCDCGDKDFIATRYHLQKGLVKSCGCWKTERIKNINLKHGLHGTRLYYVYRNILDRCYRSNNKHYKNYGGRGIKVTDEWLGDEGFLNFHNWALKNGYEDGLTIDREDVNGDYEPSNCRWVDMKTQSENRRNMKMFEATDSNGDVYFHSNQSDFAKLHNLSRSMISACLYGKRKQHKGWTFKYVEEN